MDDQEAERKWSSLWSGSADVPSLVLGRFNHKDKKSLRGTSANCRTAVNAVVRKAVISTRDDLLRLAELQLHERFPNLDSAVLKDGDTSGGKKVVRSIVDFVVASLSKIPSLKSIDLTRCTKLDVSGAVLALASCPNLQEIMMPSGAQQKLYS